MVAINNRGEVIMARVLPLIVLIKTASSSAVWRDESDDGVPSSTQGARLVTVRSSNMKMKMTSNL